MKTTIWVSVILIFIILSSKPIISFHPFSIKFESPYISFGIVFMIISITCFQLQSRKDGEKEAIEKYYTMGFKEGSAHTIDKIKSLLKKQ